VLLLLLLPLLLLACCERSIDRRAERPAQKAKKVFLSFAFVAGSLQASRVVAGFRRLRCRVVAGFERLRFATDRHREFYYRPALAPHTAIVKPLFPRAT